MKDLIRGLSTIEKPVLTNRFVEALGYAAELHLHQRRKGKGQPYVGHLLGVAAIVIQHGGGEDEVIAALLHDAVEDQGGQSPVKNANGAKESAPTSKRSRTSPMMSASFPPPTSWPTPAKSCPTIARKATPFSTVSPAASRARSGTTAHSSMFSAKPVQTHSSTNSTG